MFVGLVRARRAHSAAAHPVCRFTSRIQVFSASRFGSAARISCTFAVATLQGTLQKRIDKRCKFALSVRTMKALSTYLEQLEREARASGVDLVLACERAGIAATTLQRWRKAEASPREATAQMVLAKIKELSAQAEAA
jgi:hypothetical protein